MRYYLHQATYTPESWAALAKNPHSREQALRAVAEKLGGSVEGFWLAFGEHDLVAILAMPDNVSAAALAVVVSGGGALKAIKTTPLLTWDEGVEMIGKAGQAAASYSPPAEYGVGYG